MALCAQGNRVPTMEEAVVTDVYSAIAVKLFGEDAFWDPHVARPIVKEELNKLISTVVAHIWNKMRKTVVSQYMRLQTGKEEVRVMFESAQASFSTFTTINTLLIGHYCLVLNTIGVGVKLEVKVMHEWYKKVDRLKVLAKSFTDEDALKELERQIERMNWAYKALTGDNSPAVMKGEVA